MLRVGALALLLVFGLASTTQATAVQDKKDVKEEFKKKESATNMDDAEAVFTLAVWARDNGLSVEYKRLLRKVIKVNPDHEQARDLLGYVKYEGEWKSKREVERREREKEDEVMRAKGLVKWQGEWIPKEDAEALQKGLVKYEGRWVTAEQKERLEKGLKLYDNMWMSEQDIEKYKQGLFNVDGGYVTKDQADKLRGDLAKAWQFDGDYFIVRTNNKFDVGRRILGGAETAWVNALQTVGIKAEKPVEEAGKPVILAVANASEYMEEGQTVGDDFDAYKSSNYSQFCKLDQQTGVMRAVAVWALNDDYTVYMGRQAAAELALRTYPFPEAPPRWLIEGIACYHARYWDPRLVSWSKDMLRNKGGLVKMKTYFDAFVMDEQNILQAGLLMSYVLSEDCDEKVKEAWTALQTVLASKEGGGLEKAVLDFERALVRAERKIASYFEG
ncbi:MAG: hypothetical protein AB1486_21855 [Planctomycetota bacterium]